MTSQISQTDQIDPNQAVKRARQAIILLVLVVLFNLALYEIIFLLAGHGIVQHSSFPAFVLFLSFTLSVGIILIVGLGEKIDTKKSENEWVRRIGVTPIMTIVAVLIAMLASFTGIAEKIIPLNPESKLKFMLANIGVRCVANKENKAAIKEASNLLAVISSPDEKYIKKIEDFFTNRSKYLTKADNFPKFQIIDRASDNDGYYQILNRFARSAANGSESLLDDMASENAWIAYTVKVKAPEVKTPIPIPAVFDENHKTRVFVIFTERFPKEKQPEVASLEAFVEMPRSENSGSNAATMSQDIAPLFQLNIAPDRPHDASQVTNLDVKFFTGHSCWHIGL